jgi:hypothetical protein
MPCVGPQYSPHELLGHSRGRSACCTPSKHWVMFIFGLLDMRDRGSAEDNGNSRAWHMETGGPSALSPAPPAGSRNAHRSRSGRVGMSDAQPYRRASVASSSRPQTQPCSRDLDFALLRLLTPRPTAMHRKSRAKYHLRLSNPLGFLSREDVVCSFREALA